MKKAFKSIILILALTLISYPLFLGDFIRNKLEIGIDEDLKNAENIRVDIEEEDIDKYNELVANELFNANVDIFDEDGNVSEVIQSSAEDQDEELSFLDKVRSKEGFEEVIGYIDIPRLNERILLFYGTSEHALERGAGIMKNTSFPSHSKSNVHTVIAGHRGMTNLNVFKDIDKLQNGDEFVVNINDDQYIYRKTGSIIREPGKLDDVHIVPGKNLLTVVTCHPYLINNQRMLVFFEKK